MSEEALLFDLRWSLSEDELEQFRRWFNGPDLEPRPAINELSEDQVPDENAQTPRASPKADVD